MQINEAVTQIKFYLRDNDSEREIYSDKMIKWALQEAVNDINLQFELFTNRATTSHREFLFKKQILGITRILARGAVKLVKFEFEAAAGEKVAWLDENFQLIHFNFDGDKDIIFCEPRVLKNELEVPQIFEFAVILKAIMRLILREPNVEALMARTAFLTKLYNGECEKITALISRTWKGEL